MLSKQEILLKTTNGFDVFKFYISYQWKLGKAFHNPLYMDTKASCYIYKDPKSGIFKIKDFGDVNFQGDCFFFVSKILNKDLNSKEDFIQVLKTIDSDLALNLSSSNYSAKTNIVLKAAQAPEILPQEISKEANSIIIKTPKTKKFSVSDLDFWKQYGITFEILKKYSVFSIIEFEGKTKEGKNYTLKSTEKEPIFVYAGDKHIKLYRPYSIQRFIYAGEMPNPYIFGLELLPTKGDILFITGGEKDVLSLVSHGFNAICFNSETATIPKGILKKLNYRFKHITILYDSDKTGIEASSKIVQEYKELGIKRLILPLKGTKEEKDISDFFKLGGTSEDLMVLFGELLEKYYEESLTILKSCEINFGNPPTRPEPLISINGVTIGSSGNLLCITGSEGSGKSNYLGGLIAGVFQNAFEDIDTFGADIKYNAKGNAVLIFDTEQSEDQLYRNMGFIMQRAKINTPPNWFKVYGLVSMSRKE